MNADQIIAEYERREALKREALERQAHEERAAHLARIMEYEDACEQHPFDPYNVWCMFGLHGGHNIWDPAWTKGTYGHCLRCGRDTGIGIPEADGY